MVKKYHSITTVIKAGSVPPKPSVMTQAITALANSPKEHRYLINDELRFVISYMNVNFGDDVFLGGGVFECCPLHKQHLLLSDQYAWNFIWRKISGVPGEIMNPGRLVEKRERYLCAMPSPLATMFVF